jgi:hypothetical protein
MENFKKQRDEQAAQRTQDFKHPYTKTAGCFFIEGTDWCLTTLQSMGMPGFDERAVDAEWENYKQKHNPPEHPHEVGDEADWAYWGMFYGARWQNERCAALVAARDLKIEDLERTEKVYHMNRDWIAEAKEKIAALEAEVERLKKVNASLGRKFDTTTKKW